MADRYWVGGAGTWDGTTTTHWSATSGGAGGASVPTSSDNVFFDANSGTGSVTANFTSPCANLNTTGCSLTALTGGEIWVYGSSVVLGSSVPTLLLSLKATSGTVAISTGGVSIAHLAIYMQTSGVTYRLDDDLTFTGSSLSFVLVAGAAFNANGKTVSYTGPGNAIISGDFTGGNSLYNLAITASTTGTTLGLQLGGNVVVTNNLTLTQSQTDARYRLYVSSGSRGTTRTLTCNGTLTVSNCDFEDITGAGSANWNLSSITGGSGDCGGNSGITFTAPITTYAVLGSTDYWHTAGVWRTTSGGATTARVPLPQDTAVLDAATGAYAINCDLTRYGTVSTGAFTGTLNVFTGAVYGSMALGSGLTYSNGGAITFAGRGANTITSAGKILGASVTINCPGGSLSMSDDLALTNTTALRNLIVTAGTFNTGSFGLTAGAITSSGAVTRAINLGSSTIELMAGTGSIVNLSGSGLSFNAGTSTIKEKSVRSSNKTLATGGYTFYNYEDNSSGAFYCSVTGGGTFNSFKVSAGREIRFTASTTTTSANWLLTGVSGSVVTLKSSTATNATVSKSGGGTVQADYCTITDVTAAQASTFYATNSTLTDAPNWTAGTAPAGSQDVYPNVGHLVTGGKIPTVSRSNNQWASPSTGHLAITGHMPTIAQTFGNNTFPHSGHLNAVGYAPSIAQTVTRFIAPAVGHLTSIGKQPAVAQSANRWIDPAAGHLAANGWPMSIEQTAHQFVSPVSATVTLTGHAPEIDQTAGQFVAPQTGHLVTAGKTPAVHSGPPLWPLPSQVQSGVLYGPTGFDYAGTATGGSSMVRRR